MASFKRQLFTADSGNTYSFIHEPSKAGKPTLLFLHGFPSTLHDWIHQTTYFPSQGYGIVAPDLLGYGSSSKPSDAQQYRLKPMADDAAALLDHLNLHQVVGVGHDFGATLLSRMAAYHASRFTALVFLAVGPPRLGTPFDVDAINEMTKTALGFELLGYIPWLANDSAQGALEMHAEAAMSLLFCRDHEAWDEWFRPLGRMERFVVEDRRLPVGEWYTEELRRKHLEAFGRPDGYKGATRWYRMWMANLFAPDEVGFEDFCISQPTLFVVPREPETSAVQQEQILAAWTQNLKTIKVDSGHWMHLEKPHETNSAIESFLS